MLCRKCDTSVNLNEKTCAYCGAKTDFYRVPKISAALFSALAFFLAGVYFLPQTPLGEPVSETDGAPEEFYYVNAAPVLTENDGAPFENSASEVPLRELKQAVNVADAYINNLDDVFITNMGYLYNYSKNAYVTPETVGLKQPPSHQIYFLYLSYGDSAEFFSYESSRPNGLALFAVCDINGDFLLIDAENGVYTLAREAFASLLSRYDVSAGGVSRPEKGADDYNQIMSLMAKIYNAPVDIRYMAANGKYCVVIVSSANAAASLYAHIMYKADDAWLLGLLDYEAYPNYPAEICAHFTDFNFDALPNWTVAEAKKEIITDGEALERVRQNAGAESEIIYACGAGGFFCVQTAKGEIFIDCALGAFADIYKTNSFDDAARFMLSKSDAAPLFILKQYDL